MSTGITNRGMQTGGDHIRRACKDLLDGEAPAFISRGTSTKASVDMMRKNKRGIVGKNKHPIATRNRQHQMKRGRGFVERLLQQVALLRHASSLFKTLQSLGNCDTVTWATTT